MSGRALAAARDLAGAAPRFARSAAPAASRFKLTGIEALRGAAATAVVLYHVARHLNKAAGSAFLVHATQFGHAGVDLFFVLSGFIILFAHQDDIGRPARLAHYLGRRFTRVMPIYWVALAATLLLAAAGGHAAPPLDQVALSASLAPSFQEPLLAVAWTLQFEVVFYAAFAVLVANRVAGLVLLAGWLCLVAATALQGPGWAQLPPCVTGVFALEFFMGMLAAYTLRRAEAVPFRACALAGAALLGCCATAEDAGWVNGYGATARLAYGVPAALMILGMAGLERDGRLHAPRWLRALGAASYSVYLFQFVFIGATWKLMVAAGLDKDLQMPACYAALAGSALLGGVAVQRWAERPMLRLIRRDRPAARHPNGVDHAAEG